MPMAHAYAWHFHCTLQQLVHVERWVFLDHMDMHVSVI